MKAGHPNDPLLEDLAVMSEGKMKSKRKVVSDLDHVDDDSTSKGRTEKQLDPLQLNAFLQYIRRKFRDKINREGIVNPILHTHTPPSDTP